MTKKDEKDGNVVETAETKTEETPTQETPAAEEKETPAQDAADTGTTDAPAEEEEVETPAEFKDLVEKIEAMSVLELNQLVKFLEKKFGVSAAAVAVAPASGGDDGGEEKDSFDVELTSDGGAKIPVMKVVKEALGLGLKEAKDLVDAAPSVLKTGMKKADAEDIKKKIEEAGGQVALK